MAGTVQREWKWNLNVKKSASNEQNVKVCVWDADSTTFAFTPELTDVNGNIAEKELQENIWSVSGTTETPDPQTPHIVSLVKYGNRPLGTQLSFLGPRTDELPVETDPYITESTKATVAAYTGCTINHTTDTITMDGTGGTPVNSMARLYDYCANEAYDDPQKDFPSGIFRTTDGVNFVSEYDLVINGFTFDGQNKAVAMATGKNVTFGTTGRADDLAISGDAEWATSTTIDNLDFQATDTLDFNNAPITINVTDSALPIITNSASPSVVTLNLLGDSSIATNTGPNITVNNAVALTFKVVDATSGSNIQGARIFLEAGAGGPLTEGDDIISPGDNATTDVNGEYSDSFNFTSNQPVVGNIRKSSSGDPILYQSYSIIGTISSGGLAVNAAMIRDE